MTYLQYAIDSSAMRPPFFDENTGFGSEANYLHKRVQDVIAHFAVPISRTLTSPYVKFETNKIQWLEETKNFSSLEQIAIHPAYQKIIGMGMEAVPFILKELSKEPAQWFWALRSITNVDPVPIESRGRVKKMASAWMNWGRENGFI